MTKAQARKRLSEAHKKIFAVAGAGLLNGPEVLKLMKLNTELMRISGNKLR